jgi:hypothetical protein
MTLWVILRRSQIAGLTEQDCKTAIQSDVTNPQTLDLLCSAANNLNAAGVKIRTVEKMT